MARSQISAISPPSPACLPGEMNSIDTATFKGPCSRPSFSNNSSSNGPLKSYSGPSLRSIAASDARALLEKVGGEVFSAGHHKPKDP